MKSLIYIIIVLMSTFNIIIAQNTQPADTIQPPIIPADFEKIAEIQVNTKELVQTVLNRETQFEFISKQKTDFISTMYVQDIIKPYLNIPSSEYSNILIVFENAQGKSVCAGYSEVDHLLTAIPAVLTAKVEKLEKKSKVVLQGDASEDDMKELDALFAGDGPKLKIGMQIKNIPVSEKEKMMLDATIIFPRDLNTDRWINNIDVIKIYKYKVQRVPPPSTDEVKTEEPVKTKKSKKKK